MQSKFGLCETYLTKDASDREIEIAGFSPTPHRAISEEKKGAAYIYFKNNLPIKQRVDFKAQINETIVTEVQQQNKNCFLDFLHKTPGMLKDKFAQYIANLKSLHDGMLKEKKCSCYL